MRYCKEIKRNLTNTSIALIERGLISEQRLEKFVQSSRGKIYFQPGVKVLEILWGTCENASCVFRVTPLERGKWNHSTKDSNAVPG